MSWHFLPELEADCSGPNFSASSPSAPLRSTPSVGRSSSDVKWMDAYRSSLSGMTSRPLTGGLGEGSSTLLQEGSHARTFPSQAKEEAYRETDLVCGPNSLASFAKWDRNSFSWKTPQCLLPLGLTESSEIWPRWGLMLNGLCWELTTFSRLTKDRGYGLWPSPMASDEKRLKEFSIEQLAAAPGRKKGSWKGFATFPEEIALVCDYFPHPEFAEWIMGYPPGWTDLEPLGTGRFRQWFDSFSRRS